MGADSKDGRAGIMLFLAIGAFALLVAAWQGWLTASFLSSAERTQGVIAPDTPGGRTTVAGHPMVEFHTADGRTVRYRQNGFGGSRVGAPVTVLYRAADPAGTARIGGLLSLWTPALLPLAMGLGFILAGLFGGGVSLRSGRW